jgi:hypothetical protein
MSEIEDLGFSERLRFIARLLDEGFKATESMASQSLPLKPLLDLAIDLFLQMRIKITEGSWIDFKKNKGIKFLYNQPQDELGNTRSVRINFPGKYISVNDKKLIKDTESVLSWLIKLRNGKIVPLIGSMRTEQKHNKLTRKQYYYWLRQNRKRKGSKHQKF